MKIVKLDKWKDLCVLQIIVILYSFANIFAKFASGQAFLSPKFILFYIIEIGVLGLYAILWQQVIKNIDITVAYMNRSVVLLWSMLWAVLIFKEHINIANVLGVVIVLIGTMVVNMDE